MTARKQRPGGAGEIRVVALDELLLDPANVRQHGPRNIDAIRASLRSFGQVKPIIVDRDMVVVAGNGTVEAMRAEGWDRCDVRVFAGDAAQARAFAIADNRTAELAAWDNPALYAQLEAFNDDLRVAAGWLPDEYAELEDVLAAAAGAGEPFRPDEDSDDEAAAAAVTDAPGVYDDETIIAAAFAHYRSTGFPYPSMDTHEALQRINRLARMGTDALRSTNIGYHIPDGYHPARFTTKIPGKWTAVEQFNKDDRLTQAMQLVLANDDVITDTSLLNALGRVRNAQTAAQFRPGFALYYVRRFCPDGGRWLDTSAGWGGRIIGYAASACSAYVGIDPSSQAVANNRRMIDELGIDGATLIEKPAEDVTLKELGGAGSFDFALTSPPYFGKELYADEATQSYLRYETGDAWRDGFLGPMLTLQYRALKAGSMSIVNIADVTVKGQKYPLVQWAIDIAIACGFEHAGAESFPMPRVPGQGVRPEASEPCLLFKKPDKKPPLK